jgi:hypothetical protein
MQGALFVMSRPGLLSPSAHDECHQPSSVGNSRLAPAADLAFFAIVKVLFVMLC